MHSFLFDFFSRMGNYEKLFGRSDLASIKIVATDMDLTYP